MEINLKYLFSWVARRALFGLLLQLSILSVALAADDGSSGQSVKDTKITLNLTNASLGEFIKRVEATTPFKFTFDEQEVLQQKVLITIKAENEAIEKVLVRIAANTLLEFKQTNKNIHVRVRKISSPGAGIVPAAKPQVAVAVSGRVVDEKGEGLPGVTVVEKGTTNGTTADYEGNFTLNVSDGNGILVISYIGYQPQEVPINNRAFINATLTTDAKALKEVVVIGYGAVNREDLTGSISSVGSEEIQEMAVARVDQALIGKAAGVQVSPVSGAPGASPQIRIRGIGSISAGSGPLYIVDGFPTDNIETLSPNDIESLDILKDASATAIYGSRGANGVIIIKTKRGSEGKTNITFDTYTGWQQVSKVPEMMNSRQMAQYFYDGVRNKMMDQGRDVSGDPRTWYQPVPDIVLDVLEGRNTYDVDALDEVLRVAPQQQYQVSATGGTENMKYALSGEYFNQEGIVINSDFERYSFRANVDAKLSKKLNVRVSLNPSFTDRNMVSASGHASDPTDESIIGTALTAPNYFPLLNENGEYFVFNGYAAVANIQNPLAIAREITSNEKRTRFLGNINTEYEILPALKLNILLGASIMNTKSMRFKPQLPVFFNGLASGRDEASLNTNWLAEYTLNYNKSFGNHNLSGVAGFTSQRDLYESNFLFSNRYPNNLVPTLSAASGLITDGSSVREEWSLLSYLGRVNYNYKSKYYVTAAIRTDGSSRFGSENKWGLFPSMALAWRVSDEEFLKDVGFLSELKLRTSYGETGNNNIGNYEHFATINYIKYPLGGVAVGGFGQQRLANPGLTWEKQKQLNAGVDLSFFNSRLSLIVDHFQSRNTDLLLNVNVPSITGYSNSLQNIGEVKNTGWEFVLNTVNIDKGFGWTTDFNLSTYRNEVVKLGPEGDPIYAGQGGGGSHITMIGQPIGMFYGWLTDGVFLNQADVDRGPVYNPNGSDRSRPGDIKFVDISGPDGVPDGIIDSFDKTIMGSPYPDFYYGMTNRFTYKNISLSIGLQGTQGNEVLSLSRRTIANGRGRFRQLADMFDYWKSEEEPGDGKTPRPNDAATGNNRGQWSQHFLTPGSYLRINNISLGYLFPEQISQKLMLSNLRVYVNATNPFLFTKNTGFNPDVSNSSSSLTPGVDLNDYPLPKSLIIGLNVSF
ncbi:SusC/RagA family TonB-linked outer membrane protein [Pontibacter harenae]|uniref:SusC/RagA family TonB-linked outer membrane protein n=1 Tax=Pontibacter harenae TaxID=2894083 RepID=UPI001E4B6513|nr:TonB-dependent receptor [Pontibacter harenae]MCC9167591.1 TonB-dependent receptor [Pontibacter harenae]